MAAPVGREPRVPAGDAAKRPRGRPRTVSEDDQRHAVLAAATALFARQGLHGTTVDEIARQSGVTRPLIYQLFGAKEEVFVAVVDAAVDQVITSYADAFARTPGLPERDRVRLSIALLFELLDTHPDVMTVIRIASTAGVERAGQDLERGIARLDGALADLFVATWRGAAPISREDARLLSVMINAAVRAAGFAEHDHPTRDPDAAIDFITEIVRGGYRWLDENPEHKPVPSVPDRIHP